MFGRSVSSIKIFTAAVIAAAAFVFIVLNGNAYAAQKNMEISEETGFLSFSVGDTGTFKLNTDGKYAPKEELAGSKSSDLVVVREEYPEEAKAARVTYELTEACSDSSSLQIDNNTFSYKAVSITAEDDFNITFTVGRKIEFFDNTEFEGDPIYTRNDNEYNRIDVSAAIYYDMSLVTVSSSNLEIFYCGYDYDGGDGTASFTFYNTPYVMNSNGSYTDNTSYSIVSSNPSIVPGSNLTTDIENNVMTISCTTPCTTTLYITINGRTFNVNLTVTKVSLTNNKLLAKGKSATLKVTANSGGENYTLSNSKITWSSSKKSYVTVSSSGKIKAKKKGNSVIYAKVGNIHLGCAVSVASQKTIKAIKKAIKIGKTCTYSQPRRMWKKYYDCSSLTWRAYRSAGIRLVSKYYAAVAADQAKWLINVKKNKAIAVTYKRIRNMKFNAGDLGFQTGASNGRYKGIYHVEMFIGYAYEGYEGGKAILSPKWANRNDGYYTDIIVHFNV